MFVNKKENLSEDATAIPFPFVVDLKKKQLLQTILRKQWSYKWLTEPHSM